jgi:predicted Zn-dependent protease
VVIAAIGAGGSGYGGQGVGAAQQAAQLINQTYSRNAEREADFYGTQFMAKAGYDPHAAVTLQETFVRLSGAGEQDWLQGLFASHPASAERVTNNRSLVKQLRAEGFNGGELNQPAFAAAMGRLREAQPAYEAYDEAVKAYGEDDLKTAQNRVDTAILRYNAEAKFHALRGAIRGKQRRWADAVTNFDRAVERDDQYFAHYLARGLARVELGEEGLAKTDLERSVKLLPTADAYQALGKIAESNGDMAAAKAYYEQAAGGGGP